MKSLPVFLLALGLAGCVTSGPAPDMSPAQAQARVAPTDSARLADATSRELAHLARFDPDTLDTVYPELRALAAALVGASASAAGGDAMTLPVTETAAPARPAAAPPAIPGFSLLHAVHLASYRREDMAQRGWRELQARYPVLAGLDARLELAHIPDQGDFLRLKAGPFDTAAEAQSVCRQLEAGGQYCRATDYTGAALVPDASAQE